MIARGPTFTDDGTPTGSVDIVDLPDPAVARAFAFEEPGYQAGAYQDVLLRRWRNALGRRHRRPAGRRAASRPLPSDDGAVAVVVAVLVRAADVGHARAVLPADQPVGDQINRWRFGGRPSGD